MNLLFKIIDFFYQKKKNLFLKKTISKDIDIFIDVGAHYGDTINELLTIFSIKKIYAFEPSKKNFEKLKTKVKKLIKKHSLEINVYPFGIGVKKDFLVLNEITDSVSNTFNNLNENSKYFKKKKIITTFFGMKNFIDNRVPTKIIPLKEFMIKENINKVNLIKIDTEGFEYNTLLGLEDYIKKIDFILFEHHYDNMLIKNYKFEDIHRLLRENGFKKIFKTKMPFRKSFDYIYENKN
jgi:FkbM family methyltransferase|tara:strand:+ start:960 stop:1670 length:711 start_codon:yes stop_codon:yes gene_type:complete